MDKIRKKANEKQKERLPGLELASSTLKLYPICLERRPVLYFGEKNIALHTANARVTHGTRQRAPKLG